MTSSEGLLLLLGSGASRAAGVLMMGEITERVLSGESVYRSSDSSWNLGQAPSPPLEWETKERLGPVLRLIKRLKVDVDRYYMGDNHRTNYEDIHFLANQVRDALTGEYENPAAQALLDTLGLESQLFEPEPNARIKKDWSLQELARETTEYIHDVVTSLLQVYPRRLDVLPFLVDACRDPTFSRVTIATVNHDTILEQILGKGEIEFTDGFGTSINNVRYFDPILLEEPSPLIRVLKLHGSVTWFRLRPDDGDWTEDRVGVFETRDWYHTAGPDGRPQIPDPRPMLLIGTFNKALRYTEWFFSELFSQFQRSLKSVDTLVICGYGFGDKGINSQITQWIPKSEAHRVVVIHPRPKQVRERARGAIRRAFDYLDSQGRLHLIPKPADKARWEEVRAYTKGC